MTTPQQFHQGMDLGGIPFSQEFNPMIGGYEPVMGRGNAAATVPGKFYQVGAGATTQSLPMLTMAGLTLLFTPAVQAQLTGSRVEIVVGSLTNPATAPTLTASTQSGTLPAGTYYVRYTQGNANGQTQASPEAYVTLNGTGSITATVPALQSGATFTNVFISEVTNGETLQGNTAGTTFTQSAPLTTGASLPQYNLTGVLEEAQVTGVSSSGVLTLDSALSAAPNQGTPFLLIPTSQTALTGSNVINGNVVSITTTNTAQQLPNIKAASKITLIGLKANSGTVYIGFSNAVTNTSYGVALDPKDSIDLEITNLNLVYIYGNSGDGVSYVAI